MTKDQAVQGLVAVLSTILKMSDDAQALGGATSISGVASLNKMQSSIQKNSARLATLAKAALE